MVTKALIISLLAASLPALAQSTCYTNAAGTTLCSTPGGVIHGNTNSTGQSVYRDSRGNRLDFHTDYRGNAQVTRRNGEAVHWSQAILGENKYPPAGSVPPARPAPYSSAAMISPRH